MHMHLTSQQCHLILNGEIGILGKPGITTRIIPTMNKTSAEVLKCVSNMNFATLQGILSFVSDLV